MSEETKCFTVAVVCICITVVVIIFLMSSCTEQGERELTKRQYIANTNAFKRYDPMLEGGGQ